MRLGYDADTEAMRAELRAWLAEHRPDPAVMAATPRESSAHLPDWARDWQRRLFEAGWLVPGWPAALGGRDANPTQQMVYFEEFARTDLARSYNPQGLGIIAPSLYDFGDDDQKQRYLLPTLRGEVSWCVGMSEPDAGSDLAALRTSAVQREDGAFVVNGQKVWTSGAHHADYCMCFVRTDPDVPKHKGISVLVIDMRADGVTCRPLPELTDPDYADFNEVFFEDVVVPAENLVGGLNQGWGMAVGSLGHERAMLWVMQAANIERNLVRLRELGDRVGPDGRLGDDPRFRDTVAQLHLDSQALWFLGYKGFAKAARGEMAPEHVILKLYGSELEQRLYQAGVEALGEDSLDVSADEGGVNYGRGAWELQYLRSFAQTIAGGTSEIQRNIIAERLLGLPRA